MNRRLKIMTILLTGLFYLSGYEWGFHETGFIMWIAALVLSVIYA